MFEVKKDISPVVKKGDKLILSGDNYVLEGQEAAWVDGKDQDGKNIKSPNFYHKDLVEDLPNFFKKL